MKIEILMPNAAAGTSSVLAAFLFLFLPRGVKAAQYKGSGKFSTPEFLSSETEIEFRNLGKSKMNAAASQLSSPVLHQIWSLPCGLSAPG
jgi:hypothetical protein